jgi:uncharacterized protein (DUF2236 family)
MTMAIVFGDRETALRAARTVNQVHVRVKGDGYRALDPDLLLWVHATLADTALVTYEAFVGPLKQREREDFYQEFKLLGELLGIPRDRFPDTMHDFQIGLEVVHDFQAYLEEMMTIGPVHVDQRAKDLARLVLRPSLRLLPGPAMIPFEIVTAGLLPPTLRGQYGLAWGSGQQRAYRLAVKGLPRLLAITPPLLRVWPLPGHTVKLAATS